VLYSCPLECSRFVSAGLIQFGEFALDCNRYELLRAGRPLKLERIPMELLILLVTRGGNLVSRQEIIERLWGNDVFLDTEHGINTAIRKIRLALKDDPERPRFVQTVTGKGYRFVAEQLNGNAGKTVASNEPASESSASESGRAVWPAAIPQSRRRWWVAAVTAVALVVGAAAAVAFNAGGLRDRVFASNRLTPIHSIAVLPLANLSGDPSQDYYADGMTDELITMLAKNVSLRVVSRTSAMQYRNAHRPVRDIARELGVEGIVEGSVERSGNRVHMTVQLIHAPTDTHIWAESYDRDPDEAYRLPSELSQIIAHKLRIPNPATGSPRYVNPEAHDAYLRGRYIWLVSDSQASRELFEKAIQLQPDYAAAWSGLADSYAAEAVSAKADPPPLMEKAEQAARKALALDDSVPQAHISLAAVLFFSKWDLKGADEETARAIELNPNSWDAHHLRAYVLMAMQQNDAALRAAKRASEADPVAAPWMLGYILIRLHRVDEAMGELRMRAAAQPNDSDIRFNLSDAYWFKGMFADSTREAEAGFLLSGDKKSARELRRAFDRGGRKGAAEWWLKHARSGSVNGYISPLMLALAYAQAENKEATLKYLEQAYLERSPKLILLQNNPIFDFLHSDERYRALVNKMGLPPAY
jgi:TolB-like protein/DNA-binding winged helix-turn-helix (wHTH) protein/Tfp pilus assembly protein PilF